MRDRALFAAPILVALALHSWASGAYAQDAFVFALAVASIPLGGRVSLGATAGRAIAFLFFVVGAAIGWSHVPELGYGPGTLPRSASLLAVGSLLAAVSRFFGHDSRSRERATFVLGTLAVAASGATRLGPGYGAFAAAYVVLAFVALRVSDPARARALGLATRHRVSIAAAAALTCGFAFAFARVLPPLHDAAQLAIERKFVLHDMVGFGAGSSLGEMRDMIESDVEVLRVAPPHGSLPVDYLRGAVFDQYGSNGFWSESPLAERLRKIPLGSDVAARGTAVRIHRVAGTPSRYFLPLTAGDVRVATGAVEADNLGAVFTVEHELPTDYSFVLGDRTKLAPVGPTAIDLRVPRSERDLLVKLAGEWTAGALGDEDKLETIGSHLDHDYRYSLDAASDGDDPLLDFLFRHKLGYCTYFASAMALIARASGIPARLVTGYRVAEWSPFAREYVVREKNAHAWVEAWVNGAWRTYDPTPLQELPQDRSHIASFPTLVADALGRTEQAVAYAIAHVTPAQLLAVLAALASMWVGVRWFQNRAASTALKAKADARDRPLPFFATLASSLERVGLPREGSEPLERFARRVEGSGLPAAAQLVDRYSALRYGGLGDRDALERDIERFVRGAASS
ncbi:MAG: transglutaminase domain-containing protein [Polyangiaceae bacterium]